MYWQPTLSDGKRSGTHPAFFVFFNPAVAVRLESFVSQPRYKSGDTLVMRTDFTHTAREKRVCSVVGVHSSDYGRTQYRVRFAHETFERRIVETDIDAEETRVFADPAPAREEPLPAGSGPKSWLKPLRTKPGR